MSDSLESWSRRTFLAAAGGVAVTGLPTQEVRGTNHITGVRAEPVADGFVSPIDVVAPPDDQSRLYVVDQPGVVYRVDDGQVTGNPFLDLQDSMVEVSGYTEQGLLGMTLHPEWASNRRFYVRYSAPNRAGTPSGYSHTFVLSEFTATADGTDVVDGSERTLLEIPEPQPNHNAGSLGFGPDGYLYVGVGDGGAADDQGDGHVEDWYDAVAGGNGQDITSNLLGSILRIDPDTRTGDRPYGIPEDNPLVGESGLDEQYAWGFRNPWRFSFDGSDLYVADVGQDQYEEVSRVVAGGNYGWNVYEGTHCFQADTCPTETPDGNPLRDPIIEYSHSDTPPRLTIIGGYRYRGTDLGPLQGAYLFTDWQSQGRLFVARPTDDGGLWPFTVRELSGTQGGLGQYTLAFGRLPNDELLVCTTDQRGVGGNTGAVHRLSTVETSDTTTSTTAVSTTTTSATTTGGDPTTTDPTTTDSTTTTDGQPGFGVLATLAGVGGALGYGYHRWRGDD